jgi:hypothetical protein
MAKYKIINVSAASDKGERTIFLTDVGRTLKPGEEAVADSIQPATRAMEKRGLLKIESGSFPDTPLLSKQEEERLARSNPQKRPSRTVEAPPLPPEPPPRRPADAKQEPPTVPPPPPEESPPAEQGSQSQEQGDGGSPEPFSDESMGNDEGGGHRRGGRGRKKQS